MPGSKRPTLTEAEHRIMRVLWSRKEATVTHVMEAIEQPRLARNTIQTMLGILERKGYAKHRIEGRTFVYRARVTEDAVQHAALDYTLSRFFDGSSERLVMRLVDRDRISKSDAERIARLLASDGPEE